MSEPPRDPLHNEIPACQGPVGGTAESTTKTSASSNGENHLECAQKAKAATCKGHNAVSLGKRVEKFTWAWFTCTQSTGGVAIVLSETPHQFHGLQTIGTVVYIFNIVLYLVFIAVMLTRWILNPSKIKDCFVKPPENYFYGAFWLTLATIVIGMQRFGVPHTGPWLIVAIRVCFWIYAGCTLLSTTVHMVVIFHCTPIKLLEMTPGWFLLIFNAMLTGTVAAAIAADQPPDQALPIIVAGVGFQGLGWIVSLILLTFFIGHQLEKGWPPPNSRPGLFMPVGSSGYTIVALIGAARAVPQGHEYFATHPAAPEILLIVATWVGVFMWVFTVWLFGLAFFVNIVSILSKKDGRWKFVMSFEMSWWAIIFPNVGFTLGTTYLGQELQSPGITWVASGMTILLVVFWLLDLALMAKYVVRTQMALSKSAHEE